MRGLFQIGLKIFKEEGFLSFLKKGFLYLMQFLSIPFCKRHIQGFFPPDYKDALDFAYSKYFGLIQPAQVKSEITSLMDLLFKEKPKVVMEVGTMNGGTLFLFSRIAADDALLLSVDLPWARYGYGYPKYKVPLYRSFVKPDQALHLLRANSHDASTFQKVRNLLENREIDFLFLDGDHTYEGIRQDFEMYSPLVKRGGIVGFHDIAPHPPETDCDVFRFWNEIKSHYTDNWGEFVHDWDQEWAGISWIRI